jgi:hypothetical protein
MMLSRKRSTAPVMRRVVSAEEQFEDMCGDLEDFETVMSK